jgi:hypothetical protein
MKEPHRQEDHDEGGDGIGGYLGFAFVDHTAEGTLRRVTIQHRFASI